MNNRETADSAKGGSATDGVSVDRTRAIAGAVVVTLVVAAAAYAIYRERHSFSDSLHRVGLPAMLLSFVAGLVSVAAAFPAWREVLRGLGVRIPLGPGARVFFTSQLGKYVPGSVWPALMQMEAGRARGADRRTMLGANLVTIAIGCSTGLIVACAVTPFYDTTALDKYWWALFALPVLLVVLYPRVLHALLGFAFRLLRRAPLPQSIDVQSELRAAAWYALSWSSLGIHVGILATAIGHTGPSVYVLSIGAMALATSLGVLFVPAPAGAGVRDVILILTLSSVMTAGQALAVAVASRVILLACDVVLAALVGGIRDRGRFNVVHRRGSTPPTPSQ